MRLDVGSVLSETFRMVGQRLWLMLGLYAVYFVIQIVVMVVFGGSVFAAGLTGADPRAMGAGMILMLVLMYLAIFLISFAQSASLSHMSSSLLNPNFGESLVTGLKSALTLLGATIILMVIYFVLAIPVGLVLGLLGQASSTVSGLLAIAIIPLAVYAVCRLLVMTPVVAVDGIRNPVVAIRRAWTISGGNVLSIFLVVLALMIASVVVLAVLAAPLFSAIMAASQGAAPDLAGFGLLSVLGMFAGFLLLGIVWAAAGSAIHAGLTGHGRDESADVFS